MDRLQDPSEILEQWAQLIPEEAFEQCFQLYDIDALLENCSGLVDVSIQQPFVGNSSDSGTQENSETMSQCISMETKDDLTTFTTSSDSVGTSTLTSPGKRKCPERIMEAGGDHYVGAEPETQLKLSMKASEQARHFRKRPSNSDKSTRYAYAIRTRTEVDIVDDGYRWRKYGQKPVKNSDHPRNYYRCSTPDCPVRKQVERCTENPSNVLTTYDGEHNHPKSPSHSIRVSIPPGHADDVPSSAPVRPDDGFLGPPTLPPTNYMSHALTDHMLTGALADTRTSWPQAPFQSECSLSQRDVNVIRAHQLFMLQYQSQCAFYSDMFNLMHNYSFAQPPFLDPSLALLTAQNGGMRRMAQANLDRCTASAHTQQQASRSAAPLSRAQQRLLRIQELMGEKR